jgi:acyl carrier protein
MTLEDLCVDSLDCIEICMDVEDKMKIVITDEELDAIKTVQDIYDLVDRKQAEKNAPPILEKPIDENTPAN